jgi:hypothetical protein
MKSMARGFESKSVQSQWQDAEMRADERRDRPSRDEMELNKRRESLELQRRRVQHDLESAHNERYREQLRAALQHLDDELARLG